ncbi:MAG: ABC transporter ATP-binding protein [Pseudomonadales bacterium]
MITIESLVFSYKQSKHPVLSDISLQINSGSLFGLLGPNGAGKTTLLSLLTRQLPCPAGKILLNGADMRSTDAQGFSLVPQEYAFYSNLTVQENLVFFARVQSIPNADLAERIAEVSAITSLQDKLASKAAHLSGGLKRRLNLAIGLLNWPDLLLLDEPTVGIDPHSRRFILEAIKDINAQGTTIIYTSHYMEEVEYLCDEVAIIDNGKVLAQGSLPTLLAASHSTCITLELREPLSDTQLQQLQQRHTLSQHGRELSLESDGHAQRIYALFDHLEALEVEIVRIRYGTQNLEELFMQLTQRSLRD